MKRVFCLLIATLLCVSALAIPFSAHASTVDDYKNSDCFYLLQDFVTACPNRKSGSDAERVAADWLKGAFLARGLLTSVEDFSYEYDGLIYNSQNVIGILKGSDSSKQVVIGAHYDNVGIEGAEGADDNASGIVALLMIIEELKLAAALPYDVVFVCFGAEEVGLQGSADFANGLSISGDDTNTLVMINMDTIGAGDELLIYGEDIHTDYLDFFVSNISHGKESQLVIKPYSKGIVYDAYYGLGGYPYYQTAQASDHSSFRILGIPTAFFFSGNYTSSVDYVQSANKEMRIMHTVNDKLEFIDDNIGFAFVEKIEIVTDTVTKTLTNPQFSNIMSYARDEIVSPIWLTVWPACLIALGALAIIIALGVLHYKKLVKKSLLDDAEVKTERVFKQNADDIYDFLK